jgi:hypothetical protein
LLHGVNYKYSDCTKQRNNVISYGQISVFKLQVLKIIIIIIIIIIILFTNKRKGQFVSVHAMAAGERVDVYFHAF